MFHANQVPDLWEVVIDTADALRELLVRVRDSLRQNRSSDGNDPHAHNVLTLKVVAMPVEEYRAGNRGGKGSSDTQPRVARLTFLTLANASEPPPKRGSSGGDQEEEDNKVAVWVSSPLCCHIPFALCSCRWYTTLMPHTIRFGPCTMPCLHKKVGRRRHRTTAQRFHCSCGMP